MKKEQGDTKIRQRKSLPLPVTIALMILALSFSCFGIARGEMKTVYQKAANICMECIGIG